MPLCIAARHLERSRRKIHGRHMGMGEGVPKHNRDGARAGAHVDHAGAGLGADAFEQRFHQVLGFGTGDEDIGRHLEEQAKKLLRASDVLHRLGSQAAGEKALVLGQLRRGERALRICEKSRLVASQDVGKKHFGVAPRIL